MISGALTVASWHFRDPINQFIYRRLRSRKETLFLLIGVLVSISLALAGLEVGLRLLGLPFKVDWEPPEFRRAQFDPELGWSYIPNQAVHQQFIARQPEVPVYHNDIGARVASPDVQLDPESPTMLLIGGSYTMGFGVPYEDSFAGQLDRMPDMPYQVVNLGVEAYATDQSLLMLKRYFDRFDTRVVVYTYIDGHVERNANYDWRIFRRTARFVGTKPQFGLRPDGTLYLKRKPVRYEDLSYSRLWAILQILWYRQGPKPSLELTRALVRAMNDFVTSRGATFILVDWDWADSNLSDLPSPFQEDNHGSPFEDMGLHLVNTAEGAPPDWNLWRLPGDAHPNPAAHQRVAQLIFDEMTRLGLTGIPSDPGSP